MKNFRLLTIFIVFIALTGCSTDKNEIVLENISAPTGIDAKITIKADNSGNVNIQPVGEGITQFEVYFGDNSNAPAIVAAGDAIEHVYREGTFQVKIVGTTLNGKKSEKTIPLSVTFFAPTDLIVNIAPIQNNRLGITVKAEAKFETAFLVYYGVSPTETPVRFLEGDVISFVYPTAGTYNVKVVAITGGLAKTEYTQNVTVTVVIPVALPLTFESATVPYSFTNFGGATTVLANNPNSAGINTSSRIAALTKANGSQTWAGSFIELTNPLNFSVQKKIKIKVWSPQSGIIVRMKLENSTNANIFIERDATVTIANGWQELTYDFTGISTTDTFQRVVVFFNFNVVGTGATYYFDDISQSN